MPIVTPTGPIFTIDDLDDEVIKKVENRVQDIARARVWLRDAILEVTGNTDLRDDFDQLEVLGPVFNLTASVPTALVQEYAFSNIVPAGDYNQATLDILIWIDYPNNTIRRKLNPKHYQYTDRYQPLIGTPLDWYRFGDNIGFNPVPDKAYQVQARLLRQHPIQWNMLEATQILLSVDWNEILVLVAVEKGWLELEQYEKASAVHTLLYGDPKYPDKPGMVNGRKKRRQQENWRQQRTLSPIKRRYGAGSY